MALRNRRATAPAATADAVQATPPPPPRPKSLKRTLKQAIRWTLIVATIIISVDNNWPLEVALRLTPGFKGRPPVRAGETTPTQEVPEGISAPPWAHPDAPKSASDRGALAFASSPEEVEAIRQAGVLASRALDLARTLIQPGVTTDEIDQQVHRFIIAEGGYPSPLRFKGFPKSICTSVNEVVVHGVPDSRPLQDGDIVNVDITVYYNTMHADTSATFFVGSSTDNTRQLLAATRAALEAAVAACGAGKPLRRIGEAVQGVADAHGMGTVRRFVGHGIGHTFHAKPRVHAFAPKGWWDLLGWMQVYTSRDYLSIMQPGQTFTIEPILVEPKGSTRIGGWSDGWTIVSVDGSLSAQFEYTVLVQPPGEGPGQGGCEVLTPYLWEQHK